MDFSVVSKPRLPRKSVGAGGCFWDRRIFCAVLECVLDGSDASPAVPSTPGSAGLPAKSSPTLGDQHSEFKMLVCDSSTHRLL